MPAEIACVTYRHNMPLPASEYAPDSPANKQKSTDIIFWSGAIVQCRFQLILIHRSYFLLKIASNTPISVKT